MENQEPLQLPLPDLKWPRAPPGTSESAGAAVHIVQQNKLVLDAATPSPHVPLRRAGTMLALVTAALCGGVLLKVFTVAGTVLRAGAQVLAPSLTVR